MLRRIALWAVIASFNGYYEVAQEIGSKFVLLLNLIHNLQAAFSFVCLFAFIPFITL